MSHDSRVGLGMSHDSGVGLGMSHDRGVGLGVSHDCMLESQGGQSPSVAFGLVQASAVKMRPCMWS